MRSGNADVHAVDNGGNTALHLACSGVCARID